MKVAAVDGQLPKQQEQHQLASKHAGPGFFSRRAWQLQKLHQRWLCRSGNWKLTSAPSSLAMPMIAYRSGQLRCFKKEHGVDLKWTNAGFRRWFPATSKRGCHSDSEALHRPWQERQGRNSTAVVCMRHQKGLRCSQADLGRTPSTYPHVS